MQNGRQGDRLSGNPVLGFRREIPAVKKFVYNLAGTTDIKPPTEISIRLNGPPNSGRCGSPHFCISRIHVESVSG